METTGMSPPFTLEVHTIGRAAARGALRFETLYKG